MSKAAQDLRRFVDETGLTLRAAAEQLDATHPALLAWLKAMSKPDGYHRLLIEIWTGGKVAAAAWLTERERAVLKRSKPWAA
jgi:hypothetical protein